MDERKQFLPFDTGSKSAAAAASLMKFVSMHLESDQIIQFIYA